MSRFIKLGIFITFLFSLCSISVQAQNKPQWVKKGTSALNKQRSNDSYTLEALNTHAFDLDELKENRTDALKDYISNTYGVRRDSISISQLTTQPLEYKIIYRKGGEDYAVFAQLVDEFSEFDDFELNVFQFELYQLYAISKPNTVPRYDEFGHTTNYNAAALTMSLIPGMGQLYKGQDTKAYVIMGAEIFFLGATAIFEYQRSDCHKEYKRTGMSSWKSKETAWRNFEIGAAVGFVGTYIYNLIDAAKSKGPSQVTVKKAPRTPIFSFSPYATTDELGMSLKINF